jgi:NAD+ synthase
MRKDMRKLDYKEVKERIASAIKYKCENTNGAVLGISGGVDSAVVAYLAADALGPNKVKGILMPFGEQIDLKDSKRVVERLKIQHEIINIKPMAEAFINLQQFKDKKTLGNLQARVRMILLYGVANFEGRIVLGTGNKTELSIGYFTKYGDGGVDMLPIGDLYKTEVWELAKYIGVPQAIIDKAPTAGLWAGQTDEGEIGVKYADLDRVLQGQYDGKLWDLLGKVDVMRKLSEHKRQLAPIVKLD